MPLAEPASGFELAPSRENFSHIPEVLPLPNLIQTQTESFEWFVTTGLRELLDEITPITDFTGDFPWMTDQGTFIINGAERVVVSQLVRSPGVYYTAAEDPTTGRLLHAAKVIPNRGAWLEFETSNKDLLSVKVDRKRKIPVTTLLRAVGLETDEIQRILAPADDNPEHPYVQLTLDKDPAGTQDEALVEVYKKLRPGDPPTVENARALVTSLFFNFRRYDLGRVGRYKLNKALGEVADKLKADLPAETAENPRESRVISKTDIVAIIGKLVELNNGRGEADDIDHLGNRRIRANGELIQNQFRIGLLRMERVVKERMTITDADQATPNTLINIRPVVAAMKEFFGGSQLSQFMDQTNPLAELTNKRRLSALGPGGLTRERAGFEVRDVHYSQYGRMCPIETPEGPNIGLITSLSTYARINDLGFIETPYRVVKNGKVTDEIRWLSASDEEDYAVAQANAPLNPDGTFAEQLVLSRKGDDYPLLPPERIEFMDVAPEQLVSIAAALIPFLEHDDANRALMGSNMQRQSVPLLFPQAPLVGTGLEEKVARDSGAVIIARRAGTVTRVTADEIIVDAGTNGNGAASVGDT